MNQCVYIVFTETNNGRYNINNVFWQLDHAKICVQKLIDELYETDKDRIISSENIYSKNEEEDNISWSFLDNYIRIICYYPCNTI